MLHLIYLLNKEIAPVNETAPFNTVCLVVANIRYTFYLGDLGYSTWLEGPLKSPGSVSSGSLTYPTESISNLAKIQRDHKCTFVLYSLNVIVSSCHKPSLEVLYAD